MTYTWEETHQSQMPTSSADFPTYRVSSPKPSIGENTSETNKVQIGGQHYKAMRIQPWDYIIANELDYFQGSIVKYITRWRTKGGVEDLEKARHFLDKYIEMNS